MESDSDLDLSGLALRSHLCLVQGLELDLVSDDFESGVANARIHWLTDRDLVPMLNRKMMKMVQRMMCTRTMTSVLDGMVQPMQRTVGGDARATTLQRQMTPMTRLTT